MSLIRTAARLIGKNSPAILTTFGVVGVLSTAILTAKATIEATRVAEDMYDRYDGDVLAKEVFQKVWPLYIPPLMSGVLACVSIIYAHNIHTRRSAALLSLYSLSETALKEYREKVVETFGKGKEAKVRAHIDQDRLDKDPVTQKEVLITGKGEMLTYDAMSGRYLMTDVESLRKAENKMNHVIINDMYASLNDFYNLIGLPPTKLGSEVGWNLDRLLELEFTTMMSDDGRPCLVLDYRVSPISGFEACLH